MIKTERLNLREIRPDDLNDMHQLHAVPEVDQYNTLGLPKNIAATENIVDEWLEIKKNPQKPSIF